MYVDTLAKAKQFLWSNARLLERRRFSYLFEQAPRQPVLTALIAYQNDDGGFGNALEPDKRTTSSQPIDQEIALRVLDEIGAEPDLMQAMCDFLATITTEEGGVPFVLPTADDAPRAPWWSADDESPDASLNPTASIAGLLHKLSFSHPWLESATKFCWERLAGAESEDFEAHTLLSAVLFLENASDRGRAGAVFDRLKPLVLRATALEPGAEGYVHPPYAFAPHPDALACQLYEREVLDDHLGALAAAQQPDGGWPITWPPVTAACELEYRGMQTVSALKTLHAFGQVKSV